MLWFELEFRVDKFAGAITASFECLRNFKYVVSITGTSNERFWWLMHMRVYCYETFTYCKGICVFKAYTDCGTISN